MNIDNYNYLFPLLMNLIRYFLVAGLAFFIFYKLFVVFFKSNKIQTRDAGRKELLHEIIQSTQTSIILTIVTIIILYSPLREYTQLYNNIYDYSLWWIPVSVFIALVVHDTYFYFMHRSLHHPKLFKIIHLTHHKSTNPSPWASYSFGFIEGVLEVMIAPVILLLIPMHPLSLVLFTLVAFIINVYGHLGYEIMPKWFRKSFLFEITNTSVHHNLHHEKFNGNYGLYFRFWDRLLKTENPDYVMRYDEVQSRRFPTESESTT